MDSNRRVYGDYSLVDHEQVYQRKLKTYIKDLDRPLDYSMVPFIRSRIVVAIDMIMKRNGNRVVIFRPPTTGQIYKGEQELFPRENLWQPLANQTKAKAIHFEDHPTLKQFYLPDGVHIDYRDAEKFTDALSKLVFGEQPVDCEVK